MIQMGSILQVADNSGARLVKCIGVIKSAWRHGATIGNQIRVSIREAIPTSKVKPGEVKSAVLVRVKMPVKRPDGSVLRFEHNSVVLINNQGDPIGTRIFGPVARELRALGYLKIVSIAEEVV